MPSPDAIELLKSLLHTARASPTGVREARFRADHPDDQALIDTLIQSARILRREQNVALRPLAIAELAAVDPLAASLHSQCGQVFDATRQYVIASPETPILVNDLAAHLRMFRSDLVVVVTYLLETGIWGTYSNNLNAEDAYLTPSVQTVLRHKTYDDLIEQFRQWASRDKAAATLQPVSGELLSNVGSAKHPYVAIQRLHELRTMRSVKWDLGRLIRLCEELNTAHEHDLWMACAMLVRSITDHVPPIFDCETFSALANNYRGAKSFREHMQHLDTSLRKIADAHLHVQIRTKESLPTFNQINFSADLDALLAEIVRILKA